MAEYIEIIECRDCVSKNCDGCNVFTLSQMLDHGKFDSIMDEHHTINPAADVVEVVRCKDCKKRGKKKCPLVMVRLNVKDDGKIKEVLEQNYVDKDFWCKDGERRDTDG